MKVTIREFEKNDIPFKVMWVNDPDNNVFLHYDLPLEIGKTQKWFESKSTNLNRYDGVIEVDGTPAGLIGLLSIDRKNSKAEYYILLGNPDFKGKGIAEEASIQIIDYGIFTLGLNKIYLFTETENIKAQKLFEKVGFIKEGCLSGDVFSRGKFADRFAYGILKEEWKTIRGKNINP